ncbi:MAG: pentapeptide repeat-containing protein [Holosporales bacterium]
MNTTETLALFEQGKDAWNAWALGMLNEKKLLNTDEKASRKWNNRALATFKNDSFSELTDFSNLIFPAEAVFDKASFAQEVNFWECCFHGKASFHQTKFFKDPLFINTSFKGEALFDYAAFFEEISFTDTIFNANAYFDKALFNKAAHFNNTTFKKLARFKNATFRGDTLFDLATFHEQVDFSEATFKKTSSFKAIIAERLADFSNTNFDVVPDFRQAHFLEAPDLEKFLINHPFWWCKLQRKCLRLSLIPTFRITIKLQRRLKRIPKIWRSLPSYPFLPGDVHPLEDNNPKSLRPRYRALRRMASQGHDHLQEQDMLSGELRAERRWSDWFPWKWKPSRAIGWLYQWGSNFGRSIILPLLWFIFSTLQFSRNYLSEAFSRVALYPREYPFWDLILEKTGLFGFFYSVPCINGTKDITADQAAYQLAIKKAFFSLGGNSEKVDNIYKCLSNEINQGFPYSSTVQMLLSALFIFLFLQAIRLRFRVS